MSILWITPKWPLPPHDGARRATVQLLQDLTALGETIDLVALTQREEVVDTAVASATLGVRIATAIERPGKRSGIGRFLPLLGGWVSAPSVPLTMQPFRSRAVKDSLKRIITEAKPAYEAIVYDGLHPAAHAMRDGRYIRPESFHGRIIYRAHNREAQIWERKSTQQHRAALRGFFQWQAAAVRAAEDSLVASASSVATVSQEDLQQFRSAIPTVQAEVVPIGYAFDQPPQPPNEGNLRLLFLGTLDWPPNREGLAWFLREVWPAVAERRKDMELIIAGSGESSWLAPLLSTDRTTFVGRVAEVEPLYAETCVALVPVFFGSGTRVKAIEAARFGRPCLSTAVGVEGVGLTPGTSYIRAETREEWIQALESLSRDRAHQIGQQAFQSAKGRFERKRCAQCFLKLIR